MKTFNYEIKDSLGIHARPAGLLSKLAAKFESKVEISVGEKTADAKRLFALMGLGVKCGNNVTVSVDGADEETAAMEIEEFFNTNL